MKGPTAELICNKKGSKCKYLSSWYNGGSHCYGRCKQGAWKGIKEWLPGTGCTTPITCQFVSEVKNMGRERQYNPNGLKHDEI